MDASACPPTEQLAALLDDRLPHADDARLSAHVAGCPSCQQALERLTADAAGLVPPPVVLRTAPAGAEELTFLDRLKGAADAGDAPTGLAPTVVGKPGGGGGAAGEAGLPGEPLPALKDYEVLGVLGRGGEGVVYKARHRPLGRLVALKMLHDADDARPDALVRFRREAETLAGLRHPNIVQVYEVGCEGGRPFFALEYVEGGALSACLRGQPLPAREAARLAAATADAVHAAHRAGVLHRDLKPGNILLAPGPGAGTPKVSDFGLAKRVEVDATLTRTGVVLGTPGYMAPEQARADGGEVGPAADVYALGAILYHLLTGRPPFVGTRPMDVLLQVVHDQPISLRRLFPQTPRDLETICLKCLNKDPRKRYGSAAALADDLRRHARGEPVQARPPGPARRLWRWCRHYPVPAGLLAGVVLCLVFGLWYLSAVADSLVRSAALDSAAQQSDVLSAVNDSYSDVVKRAKAGHLSVTHNYLDDPAAIPIPATFTIELGQQISDKSEAGVQVRLYSDYPFRSRRNGGPKDDFERDALARLREDPDRPVYRFEDYKGRPALRYATARRMQETCVECHNHHPDSPKTDWKVGDVRGVVEIIRPLDRDAARVREGLQGAFLAVGAAGAALLGLSALTLFLGRRKKGREE
jgi:serine/threonine protein kinase